MVSVEQLVRDGSLVADGAMLAVAQGLRVLMAAALLPAASRTAAVTLVAGVRMTAAESDVLAVPVVAAESAVPLLKCATVHYACSGQKGLATPAPMSAPHSVAKVPSVTGWTAGIPLAGVRIANPD